MTETTEDPYVMYFAVRHSLNMGPGKIGAQCAHAAQMILLEYQAQVEDVEDQHYSYLNSQQNKNVTPIEEPIMLDKRHEDFGFWLERTNGEFRKVVLRAKDKDWDKLKELDHVLVRDAGLTEVAPGSETVLVLWPMKKSERPAIVKRLQVL